MSPMTRSRVPLGTSSASPPMRLTKSRTHSAARRRSPWCAGSALTEGMAMNSRSSSSQDWFTGGESTCRFYSCAMIVEPARPPAPDFAKAGEAKSATANTTAARAASRLLIEATLSGLRDVAKLDCVRQRPELFQALVLDLPDPFAGDVERPADLVQRPRMLAVEPVAQLEHLPFAARERPEDLPEGLLAERDLGFLVRERQVLVGDEVPELGLVLVTDRLLERDRSLRAAADVLDLLRAEIQVLADLGGRRLASELGAELALGADDLVQLLDDVHRHADGARLVRERTSDRLADPPRRVGRELEPLAVVELLRGANKADRSLLDQIEEGQALVAVLLRDRDDEAQVGLDHLLLRAVVTALDPLRELDLLRGGEQVDLPDVLQEELQRVCRDLARLLHRCLVVFLRPGDDLDMELFECVVEVVDLGGIEVELVQRDSDFVGVQLAAFATGVQKCLGVVGFQ